MATITARTQSHRRKQLFIAAAGALAALAVATGIGAWQYTDHSSDSRPVAVAALPSVSGETLAAVVIPSQVAVRPAPGGGSIHGSEAAGAAAGGVLYIAGSEDQADTLRAMIDGDANLHRAENGAGPMNASVLVVHSPDEEVRLQVIIGAVDAINAEQGLPGIRVVDLRAP